ncbi:MAG: peptide ABC transporter substrate-binding protein [Spirochaetaceae bacterium]|jgi:peptide/nickel transport system substrate-binding protein/oligopeptide transport system substrate-binding protein|nr:peptide ABC transporter substrate-binding protein [Spirochaetaceae bacterium]
MKKFYDGDVNLLKKFLYPRMLLLFAVFFLMPSAARGAEDENETPEYAQKRPPVTDRDSFTMTMSSRDLELDFRKSYLANEAQFYTALYEGLFSYHPLSMEPVPAVANRWNLSDDKKVWTFTLRDNARYWNGDTVTAEDFRSAWLSELEPERNSPYSSLFDIIEGANDYRMGRASDKAKVGIEAPDARTLVVRLTAPAAFFPSMLCHHSFSPAHPSMLKDGDWSKATLISNGPYYLLDNSRKTKTLARNEHYWDDSAAELKRITVKLTEDGDEATALWNSGGASWVSGDVNLETLTDLSGIVVNPMFATHYYFIRSIHKPWNDWRVRRALVVALPWDKIREEYRIPAKTLIYPIAGYPEIEGITGADTGEARKLLADAGYADGKGLPELVVRLSPSAESARIGGLMSAAWTEGLGIPMRIEVVPFDLYFDSLKDDGYDVASSTWIGDFADPYTFLQMWRRDSNLNDARYDDPDYEKLIDRSMEEDGAVRLKTLSDAEKLLLDRGTVLPVSYSFAVNIIDRSEIGGWFANVLDIHPFKYLAFKAYRPLPGVVLGR